MIRDSIMGMAAMAMDAVLNLSTRAVPQSVEEFSTFLPPHLLGMSRRNRKRLVHKGLLTAARRRNQEGNRRIARQQQRKLGADHATRQALVNKMTNWQRNQWAVKGYPQDLKVVEGFTTLRRAY